MRASEKEISMLEMGDHSRLAGCCQAYPLCRVLALLRKSKIKKEVLDEKSST
jgi:hypothetical protein